MDLVCRTERISTSFSKVFSPPPVNCLLKDSRRIWLKLRMYICETYLKYFYISSKYMLVNLMIILLVFIFDQKTFIFVSVLKRFLEFPRFWKFRVLICFLDGIIQRQSKKDTIRCHFLGLTKFEKFLAIC